MHVQDKEGSCLNLHLLVFYPQLTINHHEHLGVKCWISVYPMNHEIEGDSVFMKPLEKA